MHRALLLLSLVGCAGQIGVGLGPATPVLRAPMAPPPAVPAPTPSTATAPGGVVVADGGPRAGATAQASFTLDIQFYGVPLGGANDLVFVLDRSGSMGGEKMGDAKRELLNVLDRLPDGTRVGLVFFNQRVAEWTLASVVGGQTSEVVSGSKATKWLAGAAASVATQASGMDRKLVGLSPVYRHQAHRFVDSIHASGSTAAVPALRAAASMGARHIVFLSDGLANTGGDGGELMSLATDYGQHGIRIDTVGLGADQDFQVLQHMSAATGGLAVVH